MVREEAIGKSHGHLFGQVAMAYFMFDLSIEILFSIE